MNISKYLTFDEATKSPTALRLGIDNLPDEEQIKNMQHVAQKIFDPVREFVGGPLYASSFFRTKELNDNIPGSSATSQHMKGEAIDIDSDRYGGRTNLEIFNFIRKFLDFDQVINEYPNAKGEPAWVHVSLKRSGKNRRLVTVKLKRNYINFADYKLGMV